MNDDLISRKALIKWIDDSVSQYGHTYSTDMLNMWGLFKDYLINKAPTVTPDMAQVLAYESGKASAEAKTITPGGRYNGKRALSLLSEIETIARDAFNDPETLDINLYRAQALARIFQLFEYNNEEEADNGEQGSN